MTTYSRKRNLEQLNLNSRFLHQPSHDVFRLPSKPSSRKRPRLTQMRIDLGGNPQKTCKTCLMEYVPSNTEDAKLHTIFHNASVGGVDVPRAFLERARSVRSYERRGRMGNTVSGSSRKTSEARDLVVEVDRKDPLVARNLVGKVLEVVERELGAVKIETEELWSQVVSKIATISSGTIPIPMTTTSISGSCRHPGSVPPREVHHRPPFPRYDKYKAYLYIQGNKCLGLCLAERIFEACKVLSQMACLNSSSISICQDKSPAVMGISRIWVSREHRGAGIARELLQNARECFAGEQAVRKEMMAFSQPTESGIKLATAWFDNSHGWLVYTEPQDTAITGS